MRIPTPSQVHYLKTVYELSAENDGVRICDIADKAGVSKASASLAMTKLTQLGFVYKDADFRFVPWGFLMGTLCFLLFRRQN